VSECASPCRSESGVGLTEGLVDGGAAQSLAREFGPQGVHVSHTIIDGKLTHRTDSQLSRLCADLLLACSLAGLIDTERVKGFAGGPPQPDSRLSPDAIAEAYVFLANQSKSAWTQGKHRG
jgi:hypothetical protein